VNSSVIELEDVSRFYGEVLGVNRVDITLQPGITGLVGPNGSGKSTLMHLITGLLRPDRGRITVMGQTPAEPDAFYRHIGYCTQYDSFPLRITGRKFVQSSLEIHGYPKRRARELTDLALERVSLTDVSERRIEAYSKGMRQRIKLAQAIGHEPRVLVLDEPLNGLDPMARAQVIGLFRQFADTGAHVIVSSHILHEVDPISDRVVFLDSGYVVAEGDVSGIEGQTGQPMQVFIRCAQAAEVAARVFGLEHVIEARLHHDDGGLFIRTSDADEFFLAFNQLVLSEGWDLDAIGPADETVEAVYQHLVVDEAVGR